MIDSSSIKRAHNVYGEVEETRSGLVKVHLFLHFLSFDTTILEGGYEDSCPEVRDTLPYVKNQRKSNK